METSAAKLHELLVRLQRLHAAAESGDLAGPLLDLLQEALAPDHVSVALGDQRAHLTYAAIEHGHAAVVFQQEDVHQSRGKPAPDDPYAGGGRLGLAALDQRRDPGA